MQKHLKGGNALLLWYVRKRTRGQTEARKYSYLAY